MTALPDFLTPDPPFEDEDLDVWDRLAAGDPLEGCSGTDHAVFTRIEAWQIFDTEGAEWAMQKYAAAAERRAATEQQRQIWQQQLADWFAAATKPDDRDLAFFGAHLEAWGRRTRLASDHKVKTVPLFSGAISTTHHKAKVTVHDEPAVIEWAESAGLPEDADVVKVRKSVLVSELRKHVRIVDYEDGTQTVVSKTTAEQVPGVVIEAETITAKVVPA